MSDTEAGLEVIDNQDESRFEARVADHLAIADYRIVGDVISMTHTEVPPEFRGHGIGKQLAQGALEHVRKRGLKVKPLCPFIAQFIEKNPQYKDLLYRDS